MHHWSINESIFVLCIEDIHFYVNFWKIIHIFIFQLLFLNSWILLALEMYKTCLLNNWIFLIIPCMSLLGPPFISSFYAKLYVICIFWRIILDFLHKNSSAVFIQKKTCIICKQIKWRNQISFVVFAHADVVTCFNNFFYMYAGLQFLFLQV